MTAACPRCGYDPATVIRATWSIVLPFETPSQNETDRRSKNHHLRTRRYKKFRDDCIFMVTSERNRQRIPVHLSGRRIVTFTRAYGPRGKVYDEGNLIGGMKPLVDALVSAGLLVDDSPTWLVAVYRQRQGDEPATHIVIEEPEL